LTLRIDDLNDLTLRCDDLTPKCDNLTLKYDYLMLRFEYLTLKYHDLTLKYHDSILRFSDSTLRLDDLMLNFEAGTLQSNDLTCSNVMLPPLWTKTFQYFAVSLNWMLNIVRDPLRHKTRCTCQLFVNP
jgi:hypothetical protein